MRIRTCLVTISVAVLLSDSATADLTEFLQDFSYVNTAQDPGQPDLVYVVADSQTSNQQVFQVRLKTDNVDDGDSVIGIGLVMEITTDRPGVTLDTSYATALNGSALDGADVSVFSVWDTSGVGGVDPTVFPMLVVLAGINIEEPIVGPGDHLLANLVFSLTNPTYYMCVDTTARFGHLELQVVTESGEGYSPHWQAACCCPVVPTLSEWGLVIFSLLLLASVAYYILRRRRRAAAA
jgi:hypothetical protein